MSYYEEKLEQIISDEYQKQAFLSNKSTVVLAGPGSGKTTVLTLKMKKLLDDYISDSRGLACMTFSKEAAREFTDRLKKLTSIKNNNIFLGTVHSFCLKEIIKPFGEIYNKSIPFPIDLISKSEKTKAIINIKKKLDKDLKKINTSSIDSLRALNIKGASNIKHYIDNDIKIVADEYEKQLEEMKKVDYVSLIKYATEIVINNSYIRKCLEAKYPWILVDEYQDLGRPIHEMILCLIKTTRIKFFVVGDLDQSIYSFQGAKPDYLEELYNLENIEPVALKNNYRSKKEIIEGSSIVLNKNRNYIARDSSVEEAKYFFYNCIRGLEDQFKVIAEHIIPKCIKNGVKMEEIAILVAKNNQAEELGSVLRTYDIDYYISKHKFDRTDFIIWLEKICMWMNNKDSYSFEELFEYWKSIISEEDKYIDKSDIYYKKNLAQILDISKKYEASLSKWLVFLVDKLRINHIFKLLGKNDELENLEILIKESEQGYLSGYGIEKLGNIGRPINQVTISTRHSSKGLEFDIIILVGMEEDNFPKYGSKNDIYVMNEERRTCFVCISRARTECHLLKSEYEWGVNKYNPNGKWYDKKTSIFWNELFERFGSSSNSIDINYD